MNLEAREGACIRSPGWRGPVQGSLYPVRPAGLSCVVGIRVRSYRFVCSRYVMSAVGVELERTSFCDANGRIVQPEHSLGCVGTSGGRRAQFNLKCLREITLYADGCCSTPVERCRRQ